jgi:hypothetical protein
MHLLLVNFLLLPKKVCTSRQDYMTTLAYWGLKLTRNRSWRPIGLQDVKDPTLSR